jgi:hypothetical protein
MIAIEIAIDTWETEGGAVAGRAIPQARDRALHGSEALPPSGSPVLSGQDEAPEPVISARALFLRQNRLRPGS